MEDTILSNALIFGGSGMIGSNFDFGIKPSSMEVDILNFKSIESYIDKLENNISCIINLVALNLRDSEKDLLKTIDININGTTNLLKLSRKLNVPYILLSSGAVFSSRNLLDSSPTELGGAWKSTRPFESTILLIKYGFTSNPPFAKILYPTDICNGVAEPAPRARVKYGGFFSG